MIKKVILIGAFVIFAAALVAGGIYRTNAKSANEERIGGRTNELALNAGVDDLLSDSSAAHLPQQGQQQEERLGEGLGNGGDGQGRNRKTEDQLGSSTSNGQGGQGNGSAQVDRLGQGNGGSQGNGRGQGNGRSITEGTVPQEGQGFQGAQGRGQQGTGELNEEHESIVIEGTVVQAPALGVDMIVRTADDQEIMVGTGPGYLEEMGIQIEEGTAVQVNGFWEENEFKAETIMIDGQTIALRDEFGRPMWSGAARNGRGNGAQANGGGFGQRDLSGSNALGS